MGNTTVKSAASPFRNHLPDLSIPRFTTMRQQNAHEYVAAFQQKHQPPWLYALYELWLDLYSESFKGITHDGTVIPDLYPIQDEGIPIESIVEATSTLLSSVTPIQRRKLSYHIDAPEWRTWSNPELLLSDKGLRLDEISESTRNQILHILALTLSPEGYAKATSAMRINHFLGDLVGALPVMNEFSYNFVLFGAPSTTRPFGFSFYGHHLCLNILLYRRQIIISPCFTGAEPNYIDRGPYSGTRILHPEEGLGLELMQSLPPALQARAQIYKTLHDPAMPPGRWNHDDQRHLCGAYRDNRIVPYEGIPATSLSPTQISVLLQILNEYLLYLPRQSRQLKLDHCRQHLSETYFSWIGGFTDTDPYYFRIQSPVILVEFDHHSGVFLTNQDPAKFHIHTILRLPNAGDYGVALKQKCIGREQAFCWQGDASGRSIKM